jgi:hypothetical protein
MKNMHPNDLPLGKYRLCNIYECEEVEGLLQVSIYNEQTEKEYMISNVAYQPKHFVEFGLESTLKMIENLNGRKNITSN